MLSEVRVGGWRSFGEHARTPIGNGITVICGENGSGKSNLVAAILAGLGLEEIQRCEVSLHRAAARPIIQGHLGVSCTVRSSSQVTHMRRHTGTTTAQPFTPDVAVFHRSDIATGCSDPSRGKANAEIQLSMKDEAGVDVLVTLKTDGAKRTFTVNSKVTSFGNIQDLMEGRLRLPRGNSFAIRQHQVQKLLQTRETWSEMVTEASGVRLFRTAEQKVRYMHCTHKLQLQHETSLATTLVASLPFRHVDTNPRRLILHWRDSSSRRKLSASTSSP